MLKAELSLVFSSIQWQSSVDAAIPVHDLGWLAAVTAAMDVGITQTGLLLLVAPPRVHLMTKYYDMMIKDMTP